MKKLFENVEGNKFKLISENITEVEPKSSLIHNGLKKVFSEGEQEYSYKKLEGVGLGYMRNVSEAKNCALKEARELALEFGYEDDEAQQKFIKAEDRLSEFGLTVKPEKLTFVNGKPAECGCTVRVSDGGGQYSDVVEVTLCPKHRGK